MISRLLPYCDEPQPFFPLAYHGSNAREIRERHRRPSPNRGPLAILTCPGRFVRAGSQTKRAFQWWRDHAKNEP